MNMVFGFAVVGGTILFVCSLGLIATFLTFLSMVHKIIKNDEDEHQSLERLREWFPRYAKRGMYFAMVAIGSSLVTLYSGWFGIVFLVISQGEKGRIAAEKAFGPLWCMIAISTVLLVAGLKAIGMARDAWRDYRAIELRIPRDFRRL